MIPHYMPTVGGGAHLYYPNQQGGGGCKPKPHAERV